MALSPYAECGEMIALLRKGIHASVRRLLADYSRRILRQCESCPDALLWFGYGEPDQVVEQRRDLAVSFEHERYRVAHHSQEDQAAIPT